MSRGRHARDGQRRDAWHAWLADARAVIRLTWLILTILISRRLRAAGGATAATPQAEAPEVPALPDGPIPGAGTSLQPPDAAPEGVTAPATPGAATRPWVTWQDPPGAPLPVYAVRRDGIIAVTVTGRLAVIPDRRDLPVARCRQTTALEALALPAVTRWATDTATLRRLLRALGTAA